MSEADPEGMRPVGRQARAFWLREPGIGEIRPVTLPDRGPDDVLVRTLWSGVSRGTETLVFRGGVPASQYELMRAPFQDGNFPAPVKYGYLNVGVVEAGGAELLGRPVFCLYPHQTAYVVPADAVLPVPDDVPPRRAVLTGTAETALNALWDAEPKPGDRICVVGAGMVGCCVARLLADLDAEVTLVDIDPARAELADAFGIEFALPDNAPHEQDLVFHASASASGLQLSLDLLGFEGTVIELSWYGDTAVPVSLGGSFHSQRLTIRASQVGAVSPTKRGQLSLDDRRTEAIQLLRDPAFDALLTGSSPFDDLPELLPRLADGSLPALCHTITYEEG